MSITSGSGRSFRDDDSEWDIENQETRVMGKRPVEQSGRDPETELVGPGRRRVTPPPIPDVKGEEDPVVGWVVVIEGPGTGKDLRLRYGRNFIGRDKDQEVPLDFGDDHISHRQHARLDYDPVSRKFYLLQGEGRNLTYVGGKNVLTPVELKGGERIKLGRTVLLFVPMCGSDFDWQDSDPEVSHRR